MGRTYKWLGGIGYILALIPYINFVGMILVAIAWIMMGSDTRQGIFKATGIFMIISMVVSVAMIFTFPIMAPGMLGGMRGAPLTALADLLKFAGAIIAVASVILIISLVTFILELVSHFRAANVLYVKWFRYAGWMRIVSIIVAVIAAVAVAVMMPGLLRGITPGAFGANVLSMLMTALWPLWIAAIFGLLAIIFSIIAFFSIPSEAAYQPPQYQPSAYYPPPPSYQKGS